jgi:5-methylcytosine-specific restriction enzyme A
MFIKNKIYIRASIHDKYGGNRQRGISNCVKHPYIFIFTKPKNEQDVYIDKWKKNALLTGQKVAANCKKGNNVQDNINNLVDLIINNLNKIESFNQRNQIFI